MALILSNAVRSWLSTKILRLCAYGAGANGFPRLLALGLALLVSLKALFVDGQLGENQDVIRFHLGRSGKCSNGGFVVALDTEGHLCEPFISGPGR